MQPVKKKTRKKLNVEKQRHMEYNSNVTIVVIALLFSVDYYIKNTLITSNDIWLIANSVVYTL